MVKPPNIELGRIYIHRLYGRVAPLGAVREDGSVKVATFGWSKRNNSSTAATVVQAIELFKVAREHDD